MAYSAGQMRKKPGCFRSDTVFSTYSFTYDNALDYLGTSYRGQEWAEVQVQHDERVQRSVLIALAVTGVECSAWPSVFRSIAREWSPFEQLNQEIRNGRVSPDWRYFAKKLAKEMSYSYYLPPIAPTYLLVFGVSQSMYLDALVEYWVQVHDDYGKAWTFEMALNILHMQQIGSEARRKMDREKQRAISSLKR